MRLYLRCYVEVVFWQGVELPEVPCAVDYFAVQSVADFLTEYVDECYMVCNHIALKGLLP